MNIENIIKPLESRIKALEANQEARAQVLRDNEKMIQGYRLALTDIHESLAAQSIPESAAQPEAQKSMDALKLIIDSSLAEHVRVAGYLRHRLRDGERVDAWFRDTLDLIQKIEGALK